MKRKRECLKLEKNFNFQIKKKNHFLIKKKIDKKIIHFQTKKNISLFKLRKKFTFSN